MDILISLNEIKKQLEYVGNDETFNSPFSFYKTFIDEEQISDDNSQYYEIIGSHMDCSSFVIDEKRFFYATEGLNINICKKLPISDFNIINGGENFQKKLLFSLNKIKSINETYFNRVSDFIKLFYFTRISNGNQITSATFPAFPFCSFFSERALFHLPPFYENKQFEDYILSENIYHEAIHQSVNLSILCQEILNSNFDYKTSKKILIPWRNKYWETDRVLHATFVYGHLISYRIDALQKYPEFTFLNTLINEALGCYKYLRNELLKSKPEFTEFGFEQITTKLPPTSYWQ